MAREINPRLTAYDVLKRLEERRSNSNILLQDALSRIPAAPDRHLITDLVLGTLRWRGTLLFHISRFSRRPLEKIDIRVQLILMLGVYQLLFTEIRATCCDLRDRESVPQDQADIRRIVC